jgi:hypothetical protein
MDGCGHRRRRATVAIAAFFIEPMAQRYYLEPHLAADGRPRKLIRRFATVSWLTWPVAAQAVFTSRFCLRSGDPLPGALTSEWREAVMDRAANGYRVMKWTDSVLLPGAVLLTDYLSVALAPRDVVPPTDARCQSEFSVGRPYLERIRERGVTHLLVLAATHFSGFDGARHDGGGPGSGRFAERSPFSPAESYPA